MNPTIVLLGHAQLGCALPAGIALPVHPSASEGKHMAF